MNLIDFSVKRPIGIIAAVIIVVMFGIINLFRIPIQLTPDVEQPVIEITTTWPKASPYEIEREIINRQEEVLQGIEGLTKITSQSKTGVGTIQLEFDINQDMDKAFRLVDNRMGRVSDYPIDSDEPIIDSASSEDSPIAWIVLKPIDKNINITQCRDFANDVIKEELERIQGVARINVFGGEEVEMQLIVDPTNLAFYKITIGELIDILNSADISVSAGDISEGKRRYIIRTEADFSSIERINNVVIKSEVDNFGKLERVKVSDIAKVKLGYKERDSIIRHQGEPVIAINSIRDAGTNVIEVMEKLQKGIDRLNDTVLKDNNLYLIKVYDETIYIKSAIDLVQSNIIVGGSLAILILLLFLRSMPALIIISISIPISIIGSFVAMAALGRSINVISLAGLAFAVGMVVDAAIIVLENIYRRFEEKKEDIKRSAIDGTKEVWQAIFVSALTTVMVFIPILTMEVEIGQLFRDIAVAISVAVVLSLLVAVTLIPSLSAFLLKKDIKINIKNKFLDKIDNIARSISSKILSFVELTIKHKKRSVITVLTLTSATIFATFILLPKLEYLPEGNRNFVFGVIMPPPGYNLDTTTGIAKNIEQVAKPHLHKIDNQLQEDAIEPKIDNFFFVARENVSFTGATALNPSNAAKLIPILSRPIFKEPGTFGFMTQPSIFGRNISSGRIIEVDISGSDLEEILKVASSAIVDLIQILPLDQGNQFRPNPGLELGFPEIRVIPNDVLLADNGLTPFDLATSIRVFNDGFRVKEITVENKIIDLTVKGLDNSIKRTQDVGTLPIITKQGKIVPVNSLAEVKLTASPMEILHKNKTRTVTIEVRPSTFMPLEVAIEIINQNVIDKYKSNPDYKNIDIRLSGTADKLTIAWDEIVDDLIVAIIIVYLVMAILFNNFLYPLVILFSVPIAAFGGILGLATLNIFTYQALDMLTMLGFVILIGIVVNNAILIVHNTNQNLNIRNMSMDEAIYTATKLRIRPIFMSSLTSVFGMLPLVLFPGAGSELYRGLGSVVVGGLALSAVLTLIIVPAMLTLFKKEK